MLRRGVLQAVRGAGPAGITSLGAKRALHGSRPALAKILCSDSIDPVSFGDVLTLSCAGTDGVEKGAPPRVLLPTATTRRGCGRR